MAYTLIASTEDGVREISVNSEEDAARELANLRLEGFEDVWGIQLLPEVKARIVERAAAIVVQHEVH